MKEYICPNCKAVLSIKRDKFICEYCRSTFDKKSFAIDLEIKKFIPFKISIKEAKKIYKNNIKSLLLTPSCFQKSKNINKIEAIYIPTYIYSLDATGEVSFECDKDSTWKSSGTKYKKKDVYKVIRSGNMSLKDMPIISTTDIDFDTLENVFPYDYNNLSELNNSVLDNYKIYLPNKTKDQLLDDIKSISKREFIREVEKDIKNYNNIKAIDNSINLYNSNRKYILIPIYLLELNYKGKKYTYLINGLNGTFYGNIPINKKRLIFIWILIFLLIAFGICFVQVML